MIAPDILKQYKDFSENVRKLAPKTVEEYLRVLQSFGDFDLIQASGPAQIDEEIIRISKLPDNDWVDTYVWKYSSVLKSFYKWLLYREITPKNLYPYSKIRKPRNQNVEFLEQHEFDFIQNNGVLLTHQDRTLINLFWDTGARRSEAALAAPCDFDFTDNIYHITAEKSKGGYGERYLPFSQKTADLLQEQIKRVSPYTKQPCVFVGAGYERICPTDISERFNYIGRYCLPKTMRITPHKFRHSFALRLLEAGASDLEVVKLLGHASVNQTIIYTHMTKKYAIHARRKYLPDKHLQTA